MQTHPKTDALLAAIVATPAPGQLLLPLMLRGAYSPTPSLALVDVNRLASNEAGALLSRPGVLQTLRNCGLYCRRVHVVRYTHRRLAQRCIAGVLLALPCAHEALALPLAQPLGQLVYSSHTGHTSEGRGTALLAQQPGADGLSRIVEFLTPVPPKCGAVPDQKADKECEKRDKGVLEKFKHDHPVVSNLIVAGLTFLGGFYIGGGFQGGK